ncbi:hypothetical protein GCM10027405_31760 [Arthrobacter alkaliphilus]|uniref:IclR family transcriptional regulator n=1 Tax=Arthrobacter alkaliphilus TaxID=369936 RepID=UPI001F38D7DA|nr:IclR family transcriptional regulator [Arthrobacter alkaliphilus]
MFQLGLSVSNALGFEGTASPILSALTDKTHEGSSPGVLDADRFLTVAKIDGPKNFRVAGNPGLRGYLHCSAVGKALLAFASDDVREGLIEVIDLPALTPKTIISREALREEIHQVRWQGYAVTDEENDIGTRAVAVPVLDEARRAVAAISCTAPTVRMSVEELTAQLPVMQVAAGELAARLPRR